MDPDSLLTIGLVIAALSVPAMVSAYSDRRRPLAPLLTLLIAGGMVLYAMHIKPGGYTLAQIPEAFYAGLAALRP